MQCIGIWAKKFTLKYSRDAEFSGVIVAAGSAICSWVCSSTAGLQVDSYERIPIQRIH